MVADRTIAQLFLVMRRIARRCGESIRLKPKYITLGSCNTAALGTAVVALGVRGGTKAKRALAIIVEPREWRAHLFS